MFRAATNRWLNMFKVFFVCLGLLLLLHKSNAQTFTPARQIAVAKIPGSVKMPGHVSEMWQWKDRTGDNMLILSARDVYNDKIVDGEQTRAAQIYAYQWVKVDTGYQVVWKLTDYITECPFDVTLGFFAKSTRITDLDADSVAEVTLVYKMGCRSDVSPDYMKLIMREGAQKYALRGLMCDPGNGPVSKPCVPADSLNLEKMPPLTDEWAILIRSFGRYESEKDFASAPHAFLPHARSLWLRYITSFD